MDQLLPERFQNKLYMIVVFLIMAVAYSIPFGWEYTTDILRSTDIGNHVNLLHYIAVLWFFTVNKNNIIDVLKNKVFMVLTLFVLIHIMSLLWSEDVNAGWEYIEEMLIYMYLPIFGFATVLKQEHIKYVLIAFVLGMFTNEIISYLIYFDLYQTNYSLLHKYPVGFLNHIMYSVLVSFSAILILYQAKNFNNMYVKGIYVLFFITMTVNLVISGGRTGYIVYFMSLIILLFSYYKLSVKNFFQLLIFPILVFMIGYEMNKDVQNKLEASIRGIDKIVTDENYNTSLGARIVVYPIAYNILSQPENSFIWGAGTGNILKDTQSSIKRTHIYKVLLGHLHNSYLEAYVNAGIVALLLLLLLFYYIWTLKIEDPEMRFIKQLIIINISIAILSDVILSINEGMMFFAVFVSLLFVQERYERIAKV